MQLISYKVKHDTGFAPNPYFGILTLATCKPAIRRSSKIRVGDWIAGWTAASSPKYSTPVGKERLVYLACISEIITFEQYWNNFPQKRPSISNGKESPEYYGDNIYEPDCTSPLGFKRVTTIFHCSEKSMNRDLGGENVIICKKFYYFSAANALEIPQNIKKDFNNVLRGHKLFNNELEIHNMTTFVQENQTKCKFFHT